MAAAAAACLSVQKAKTRPQIILAPIVYTDKGDQIPGVGVVVDWLRLGGVQLEKASVVDGWEQLRQQTGDWRDKNLSVVSGRSVPGTKSVPDRICS